MSVIRIPFKISGSTFGYARARVFYNNSELDPEVYVAGESTYIEYNTETQSPNIELTATIYSGYTEVSKFDSWYVKESVAVGSEIEEFIGIKSNDATFWYDITTNDTFFIRAQFIYRDDMYVNVNIPTGDGVINASNSGRWPHNKEVEVSASIDISNYTYNSGNKWKIYKYLRNGTTEIEYSTEEIVTWTVNAILYESITFQCLLNRLSKDSGDFTISGSYEVGSTLTVILSSNIYKPGCICRWLLDVPSNNGVNSYVTYGEDKGSESDWLYHAWKSYETSETSPAVFNLPLPDRLTEIFSSYTNRTNNISTLACRLKVIINSDNCTETVKSIEKDNSRSFDLTMASDYTSAISNVNVVYGSTYHPSGTGYNLLVAGWSNFYGSFKTQSVKTGGGLNLLKVYKAAVAYNDTPTPYYTYGGTSGDPNSTYVWFDEDETSEGGAYGIGLIGGEYAGEAITLGQSETSILNHVISITATNTSNIDYQYIFNNSQFVPSIISSASIYGWYQPKYQLVEIYRCTSSGVVSSDISANNCIYIKFIMSTSPVMYNNVEYNRIKLLTDALQRQYADPNYLKLNIYVNETLSVGSDHVLYDGNDTYHVILGSDETPLDVYANYTIGIYCRDDVKYSFSSSSTEYKDYFAYFQSVNSSMPLSLYQDTDTNKVGAGLGVEIHQPGTVTIGADSIFDTDINLIASKTIPHPEGSGTSIETTKVNAYDLVKRGSSNSICVPRNDLELGLYANNIKMLTKAEFANLLDKDEHTLYIIYKE